MILDRDTVLDLAIEVATELPAVTCSISFYEHTDGSETSDVRQAERVCASGAVRVAIHRLSGLTAPDDLRDAECALFGMPVYFRGGVDAVESDRIPAFLATLKEA